MLPKRIEDVSIATERKLTPTPSIIADLPRFGMCNCLFVWGRAYLLARQMEADLGVYGWNQFRVGPWLRGERVKRSYSKYFDPKNHSFTWLKYQFAKRFGKQQISYERQDGAIADDKSFHVLNHPWIEATAGDDADQFQGLRGHEADVLQGLMEMIRPNYRRLIDQAPAPVLAVHVRRGDYQAGNVRYVTPDSLFIEAIQAIRESCNEMVPVTIFSDAWPAELEKLLALPSTSVMLLDEFVQRRCPISKVQLSSFVNLEWQ